MPMSQHRPALAAILVAFVAVLTFAAVPAMAAPASSPPNPAIAQDALRYDGTYQGECWTFMKKVVSETTGRQVGFDYRDGYFDAGAIEVSLADAAAGDIIQVANDADTGPNADYAGLHTSFIVSSNGDGTFTIVDSNMNFDGIVHIRENYNPGASAARYGGLTYHIYRISGSGAAPASTGPTSTSRGGIKLVPVDAATVAVGDKLFTSTTGDVLRLRTAPNGSIKTVLSDRTPVTVLVADAGFVAGYHWVQVSTPAGDGFVATEFLARSTGTADAAPGSGATPTSTAAAGSNAGARSSGSGNVNPVLPFRRFVPGVTSEN